MKRRALALVLGAALLAPLFSSPAGADTLGLDPAQGAAGSRTVVSGCGWIIGDQVSLVWDDSVSLGSTVPDAHSDGCIEIAVTIPTDVTVGEHTVSATQGDRSSSATFDVTEGEVPFAESSLEPKRQAWFMDQRLAPDADFSKQLLLHARQRGDQETVAWKAHGLVATAEPTVKGPSVPVDATALSAWANLGPAPSCDESSNPNDPNPCLGEGPVSGRATAVAPDPTDPGTYYVGTSGGGVWKTVTGGRHWTPLFDQMPTMQIGSVAVDPFGSDRVLVGTGATIEKSPYLGLGVFRSDDGGQSWSHVAGRMFDGCTIDRIVPDPLVEDVFVLAAQAGAEPSKCEGGAYISTDGGTTWKRWLDKPRVWDLAMDGSSVFAGVHQEGVYRSSILRTANGKVSPQPTWVQVGGGLPTSQTGRVAIAVAPSDPDRVYVVMGHPQGQPTAYLQGGWTSKDGGSSWTAMDIPTTPDGFLSLAVSPTDPGEMYLGAGVVWQTRNAGQSFDPKDSYLVDIHDDVSSLAFDAAGRLVAGTDGGVYRTTTAEFPEFDSLNTDLSTMLVYRISGTLDGGGSVLAGMQDNGTAHYTGSVRWNELFGGDGGGNGVDPRDPRVLYYTYNQTHVLKEAPSLNDSVGIGLSAWKNGAAAFVAPLVLDTARPDRLYFGHDQLWRSPNGGQSWDPISASGMWPSIIAPAPSDPNVVYTWSENNADMRVTRDGGTDWDPTGWQAAGVVTDIAVHPQHANEAWVTVSGFGHGHVFFTDDYGKTWNDVSGFLPDTPVNTVALDARRSPASLFVGTDVGVFVSYDNGGHWAKTGGGLPNVIVTDLLMDTATNHLIVGTYGRGVWTAEVEVEHHVMREADAQQYKRQWIAHAETFSTQSPSLSP